MKKTILIILVIAMISTALGGCSLMEQFGVGEPEPEVLINGTNTGNILNYGIGVQFEGDLIFVNTTSSAYDYGNVVRSSPETGDNSLLMEQGGLYMSVVDGVLYYCRPDGIYKAAIADPQPELLVEGAAKQLQISGGRMYFIKDNVIECTTMDGEKTDFAAIQNADCLNVYGDAIYYVNTQDGYIYSADKSGSGAKVLYDQSVDMFYIIDDVVYFIDSADGHIKRMTITLESLETAVAHGCSGFNVNQGGMYYTRMVDGISACCNAGYDGVQENVISDFGDSAWHVVCMFGDAALVAKEEDILGLK